jgi:hypothetical protein
MIQNKNPFAGRQCVLTCKGFQSHVPSHGACYYSCTTSTGFDIWCNVCMQYWPRGQYLTVPAEVRAPAKSPQRELQAHHGQWDDKTWRSYRRYNRKETLGTMNTCTCMKMKSQPKRSFLLFFVPVFREADCGWLWMGVACHGILWGYLVDHDWPTSWHATNRMFFVGSVCAFRLTLSVRVSMFPTSSRLKS